LENNPLSLDEYSNQVLIDIKKNIDPNVKNPINITFGNKKGKKIIFDTTENNISVKKMQVWTMENYRVYILSVRSESSQFHNLSELVNPMITSFTID
jgi:hypothetical protein